MAALQPSLDALGLAVPPSISSASISPLLADEGPEQLGDVSTPGPPWQDSDRNLNTVCKPFLQTGQAAAGTTPLLRNPEPWSPTGPFLGPHLNESPSWRDPGQHRFFLSGTLG